MVLIIGRVGRPERGVIKNPNLPSYVLHVNFHLLHGAVEDTFSLFYRKGDFFRHEAAIVDWNPGSVVLSKRNQHQPARLCPSELSLARMETLSVWPRPKGADCYRAHRTSCLGFGRQQGNILDRLQVHSLVFTDFDDDFCYLRQLVVSPIVNGAVV